MSRISHCLTITFAMVSVAACAAADEAADDLRSTAQPIEYSSTGSNDAWEVEFPAGAHHGSVVLDTGESFGSSTNKVRFRSTANEICTDQRVTDGTGTTRTLFSEDPCVAKDPTVSGTTMVANLHYSMDAVLSDAALSDPTQLQIKLCYWKCKVGQGCWKHCTIIKKASGV